LSLIVSFFLLGLAAGYRFWGRATSRWNLTRHLWVKTYGWIEFGIGAYALLFPKFFHWLSPLLKHLPADSSGFVSLLGDACFTAILILPPTFAMGATIPILTHALPESLEAIDTTHARIYGVNSLGAALGAILTPFILVPRLGFEMSLVFGASLNILGSFVLLANPFAGSGLTVSNESPEESLQATSQDSQKNPGNALLFSHRYLVLWVAVSGALTLGLEILLLRLTALTVGSAYYCVGIVMTSVISGLALGTLRLQRQLQLKRQLPPELLLRIFATASLSLLIMILTAPYWPIWVSHIRVSLTSLPSNYWAFLILATLLLSVMSFPFFYQMGRLLPLVYSWTPKDENSDGRIAGQLYFANTLGTFAGALGIGYLALNWFSLDQLLKILLLLVSGAGLFASLKLRVPGAALVFVFFCGCLPFAPSWNRVHHAAGIFRERTAGSSHFKGVLHLPPPHRDLVRTFLEDGPDLTAAVLQYNQFKQRSASLFVNGKSDSNTLGDRTTNVLMAVIPYLFARPEAGLQAALVGLGTGTTATLLAQAKEIQNLDVIEISKTVIRANQELADFNDRVLTQPKLNLKVMDAFRYFSRTTQIYDIVVSEPTNPWTVGVENLFTPEYYQLIKSRLHPKGVFVQWVQTYDTNPGIVFSMLGASAGVFSFGRVFRVGRGDLLVLLSQTEFSNSLEEVSSRRRFEEPVLQKALNFIGVSTPEEIQILSLLRAPMMRWMGNQSGVPMHSLENPHLAELSNKARFLGESVNAEEMIDPNLVRALSFEPVKAAAFQALVQAVLNGRLSPPKCEERALFMPIPCLRFSSAFESWKTWQQSMASARLSVDDIDRALDAYTRMRASGLFAADTQGMTILANRLRAHLLEIKKDPGHPDERHAQALARYWVTEVARDEEESLMKVYGAWKADRLLSVLTLTKIEEDLKKIRSSLAAAKKEIASTLTFNSSPLFSR
jgi:spermidine synthase